MAISYIANALGATNSTTSFSITLPTTQAGDLLILEFTHRGTGDGTIGGTSISTGGLTWTLKHSQLYASSAFSGKTYWTRATGNHSGQTVTGSSLTNSCAAILTQYRGAYLNGDPLADATIVGEENASGNETQAEITTSTNGAYVVLVVVNSPDLAVSSQSSTSPGALTERAERLSTGGTDTSIAHASAEKATAGATGSLTWSQTNAVSGSWAYAIRPQIVQAATGTPSLPLPTAAGEGEVTAAPVVHEGYGTPSLPILTASGAGKRTLRATGAPSLPVLTASGAAKRTLRATGSSNLPLLTSSGVGKKARAGTGAGTLPVLTASGAGKKARKGAGTPSLPTLTASGSAKRGLKSTGAPSIPILTASGEGDVIEPGPETQTGSGAATLPLLTASGAGKKTRKGAGACALPALTASGVAKRALKGVGAVTLPSLSAEGAGKKTRKGAGACDLPFLVTLGSGRRALLGAGALSLPLLEAAGSASLGVPITPAPPARTIAASGASRTVIAGQVSRNVESDDTDQNVSSDTPSRVIVAQGSNRGVT